VNEAESAPAAIPTVDGTVTLAELLFKAIANPPLGAALVRRTVQVMDLPGIRIVVGQDTVLSLDGPVTVTCVVLATPAAVPVTVTVPLPEAAAVAVK
jgi:hypothetical protein